jgi:hypothetical protein
VVGVKLVLMYVTVAKGVLNDVAVGGVVRVEVDWGEAVAVSEGGGGGGVGGTHPDG